MAAPINELSGAINEGRACCRYEGPLPSGEDAMARHGFAEVTAEPGVSWTEPVIYRITIRGVGVYVGTTTNARKTRRAYWRDVANLLAGLPYRAGAPGGYRRIHLEMVAAVRAGVPIDLHALENGPEEALASRARYWIGVCRAQASANGLSSLNGGDGD